MRCLFPSPASLTWASVWTPELGGREALGQLWFMGFQRVLFSCQSLPHPCHTQPPRGPPPEGTQSRRGLKNMSSCLSFPLSPRPRMPHCEGETHMREAAGLRPLEQAQSLRPVSLLTIHCGESGAQTCCPTYSLCPLPSALGTNERLLAHAPSLSSTPEGGCPEGKHRVLPVFVSIS